MKDKESNDIRMTSLLFSFSDGSFITCFERDEGKFMVAFLGKEKNAMHSSYIDCDTLIEALQIFYDELSALVIESGIDPKPLLKENDMFDELTFKVCDNCKAIYSDEDVVIVGDIQFCAPSIQEVDGDDVGPRLDYCPQCVLNVTIAVNAQHKEIFYTPEMFEALQTVKTLLLGAEDDTKESKEGEKAEENEDAT